LALAPFFFLSVTLRPGSHSFADESTVPENAFFEYLMEIVDLAVSGSGDSDGDGEPDGEPLAVGDLEPVGDADAGGQPTGGGPPGTQDGCVEMCGAVVAPTFIAHSPTIHIETTARRIDLDVRRFIQTSQEF
jgi:hypothetical protein